MRDRETPRQAEAESARHELVAANGRFDDGEPPDQRPVLREGVRINVDVRPSSRTDTSNDRDGITAERVPSPVPPADGVPRQRSPRAGSRGMFAALRRPQFRLLLGGNLPSFLGMQMGMFALSYTVYTLTGLATALGAMGLAWGLPMLILSPIGGVVADRFPRRSVMMATQLTLCLTASSIALLALAGLIQVWHLFVVALFQGIAFAFNSPARTALVGEAVGKEDMGNAIALNNAALNFSRVVGPSLAGALVAVPVIGTGGVLVIWAISYIFALAALLRLSIGRTPPSASGSASGRSGWHQLTEGLRYIWHSPTLRVLLAFAFIPIILGMPYQMLLPVFALSVQKVGAEGMGLMQTANGVGALVGSLGVAALSTFERKATLQLAMGMLFGIGLIGFALSEAFPLALLLLFCIGLLSSGYMAINNTLIMSNTAPELYGRVMSVAMMTFALMPIGSLPAASLSDLIGPRLTLAGGGLLLAATIGMITLLTPSYRQIR